jgi:hypothetical protein
VSLHVLEDKVLSQSVAIYTLYTLGEALSMSEIRLKDDRAALGTMFRQRRAWGNNSDNNSS